VEAGTVVTFSAVANGEPAPHVQWQVSADGGTTFHNLPHANTDALTFTARAYQNGDEFRAVFTEPGFTVTTTAATLTVDYGPRLTTQPASQTVATGSQVTLTAGAKGNPAPTVRWYTSTDNGKTWTAIAGATSGTYTFTAPAMPGSALYHAVFTSTNGTATSKAARVTFDVAPVISTNPVNTTAQAGSMVTFTAAATGTPNPRVQWQISSDGITWRNIPLATTNALTITAITAVNGDEFRAVFRNGGGTVMTSAATLTVTKTVPV
jgi:hypothetical protein